MSFKNLLFVSLVFSAFSAQAAELGTRNNPVKIAIVPSGHATKALERSKPIAQCIEQVGQLSVTISIPNSYIAVGEGMGSEKVDVAFGDIIIYLLAKKKFGAEPILQVVRYGTNYYQSAIFVKKDSPIKSVKDLNNKKFAFTDASSASSYIFPMMLMKKNKIKFAQEVPAGSMDASIIALMQGQVDASAAFYNPPDSKENKMNDARIRVLNIYPDIEKETRVLWLSSPIPNEPVFVRKGLSPKLKEKLTHSIKECIAKYPHQINSMDLLNPIKEDDRVYDNFIKEIEESGLSISNIFAQK